MKLILSVVMALMVTTFSLGQERKVLGRIVDHDTKKPVKNANVTIAGTTKTTATNFIGYFELMVGPNDKTFNITHVGYASTNLDIPATEKFQFAIESRYIALKPIYLDEFPKNLATVPVVAPKNPTGVDEYFASPSEGFDRFYVYLGNTIDRSLESKKTSVDFTIDITGKAIDIHSADSLSSSIIKTLTEMTAWIPAQQKGAKVPLTFTIEILPKGPSEVINKITKQLLRDIKYPLAARRIGLDGFVDLVFYVNDVGVVTDMNTINDLAGECGNEIRNKIQNLPADDVKLLATLSGSHAFLFTAVFGLDQAPKRAARPSVHNAYVIPEVVIIGYGSGQPPNR